MALHEEHYRLSFFLENGFVRRRCRVCGEFFWTLDAEREVCGESPCVPYGFVDKTPTRERLSVREARSRFLTFFKERSHEVINPYPVVARWRTDLYLVHASIIDFQPWVTNGIAPPPANPLVISQPCIRMVDIDKVGLTFGRHLTIFEMGGHHAFNYPDKPIYWKEETTAYCHEFMTKTLGVDPISITYKEAFWSGGGNAGPCLEVISHGLELATLVFMQYKTDGEELEETPIKTVDTGYGIERYAWFSQGTPSCFDAIYGDLYPKVLKLIPVERPEEELLRRYSPHTALVTPKKEMPIAEARRLVSKASGIPLDEIEKRIIPLERLYAALDFTKAIAFIISAGVVPSNVKAGYLARLLIRKTYRLLRALGSEDKLLDLLDLQLVYWSYDFPTLGEMRDEVLDIVGHEVEKFKETLAKGIEAVEREVKGGKPISTETLIRFYDERGITPDIVAEVAERHGAKVSIPEDFFEQVAARHLTEQPQRQEEKTRIDVSNYPATRKLYYEQPYSYVFKAKVIAVIDGHIILDQTLFYPEGGGQVGDTGALTYNGGECRIIDTQIVGDVIIHRYQGNPPPAGAEVEGIVDRERRLSISRHHTATHIMIGTVRRVLGKHAWQAGAKKEPDKARLDIYHHRRLTPEDIRRIEKTANEIVAKRLPVRISWQDRNEAERIHGFFLYQGGEVPSAQIRVVEIQGWDAEACGGIHCENTEDVGLIKIIRNERIQDGVERLIFSVGPAALQHIQQSEKILEEASGILSSQHQELPKKVAELENEVKELRKTLRRILDKMVEARVSEVRKSPAHRKNGLTIYTAQEEITDQEYLIKLAAGLVEDTEAPALSIVATSGEGARIICYANQKAIELGYKAGEVASKLCRALGGGGGGKPNLGQGAVQDRDKLATVLSNPEKFI